MKYIITYSNVKDKGTRVMMCIRTLKKVDSKMYGAGNTGSNHWSTNAPKLMTISGIKTLVQEIIIDSHLYCSGGKGVHIGAHL